MLSIDLRGGRFAELWRTDCCAVLYELAARRPGQASRLEIGDERILIFQDAASARHISRTRPQNYHKHFGAFVQFFGESRLTSDGARWETLQRLSQPSIAATDPTRVVTAAVRHFTVAIDAMLRASGDGPVLVDPHLDRAAAAVIAEVTLGFGPDDISPTLLDDFRALLRYASVTTWNVQGAERVEDPLLRGAAIAARDRLQAGIDDLLVRREFDQDVTPLLRVLIDTPQQELDRFSEICTLLFAGSDTSAASLGWALYLLANAPLLQEKLAAEVERQMQDSPPSLEALTRLDAIGAFQNEAMRIFPPIPILSRIAQEADVVGDVAVEAGQKVLLSIIGLHQDSRTFPNPRRVALDRFPQGSGPRDPMAHFQPFGTGRRACGGARIANLEVTTALSLLVSRLHLRVDQPETLGFEWLASLRRRGGQRLQIAAA